MNNQHTQQQLRYKRQTLNFAKKLTFFFIDNNFIKERLLHVQRTQSSLKNYKNYIQKINDSMNDTIESLIVKLQTRDHSYKELVKVSTTES